MILIGPFVFVVAVRSRAVVIGQPHDIRAVEMGPRALVGVDVLDGVGGLVLVFPDTEPVDYVTPARRVLARLNAADDFKAGGNSRNGQGTGRLRDALGA